MKGKLNYKKGEEFEFNQVEISSQILEAWNA